MTAYYVQNSAHHPRYFLLSTDAKPAPVPVGTEVQETDSGLLVKWTGLKWMPTEGGAKTFVNVAASATDSSIVAAVAATKVRVVGLVMLTGSTATNVTFNSKGSGAGTAISMTFANGANGGAALPYNPAGWFDTNSGEALTVTTGAGSTTGIQVVYQLI